MLFLAGSKASCLLGLKLPRVGAFPGIGDVLTSALVHHALQTGASKLTLARMIGNVAADFAIGAVPILGNLFAFV